MKLAIGTLIWITPIPAFRMIEHIVSDGGSWWWWVPALTIGVVHSALLEWYVRESWAAAIHGDAQ